MGRQPCSFPITSLVPFPPSSPSPTNLDFAEICVGGHRGRRQKGPFFCFSPGILTIARGPLSKGKKPAARRDSPAPSPSALPHHILLLPIPGRPADSAKTQLQTPAPGKELETASPPHPASPPPSGQYCEAPSCSSQFPGEGPAVVGPGGPLRREGTKGILGPTIHLPLPLFSPPSPPSPPLSPSITPIPLSVFKGSFLGWIG